MRSMRWNKDLFTLTLNFAAMPFSPRASATASVKPASPSHSVLPELVMRSAIVAGIIFVIAHFAMLVGVTTPEKFYFDEVH